jgi:DNA-directed RNA polymerase subunit omega
MLLYPAMNDLLKKVPSRYLLVNVVANRARTISADSEQTGIPLTEKPVTLAVREVASGALRMEDIEE